MEGSVDNVRLGNTYNKIQKSFATDQKSPISSRRGLSLSVSDNVNGNVAAVSSTPGKLVNGDRREDSMAFNLCSDVARSLGTDFVHYKVGFKTSRPTSIYAETLRRVGDEIEEKYDITLSGIVNKLQYDPDTNGKEAFNTCLESLFSEGQCSWGRVVMVYVFAARLARYCQKQNREDVCIEHLVNYSGDYVAEHLTQWINDQGGWADFCNSFKAKDWRDKAVFNSLLVTGLFLGGMATLRLFTK